MKIAHRTRWLTTVLLVTCGLVIATTASAKNPKEIKLEIVDNELKITSKKTANDCPLFGSGGKGCIKVKKGEKSAIEFHLKSNKCTLESGTKFELNAVYLGGYNSSKKPDPSKFGFDNTDQADYDKVNKDFNIADRSSGLVTTIEKKENKLSIYNNNQSKYTVWYKVEAICKREDGKTAHVRHSDPRVKNGGAD